MNNLVQSMPDQAKAWVDSSSWWVVISSLVGWLPQWAALASIIWTGIQMYDWYKSKNKRKRKRYK